MWLELKPVIYEIFSRANDVNLVNYVVLFCEKTKMVGMNSKA